MIKKKSKAQLFFKQKRELIEFVIYVSREEIPGETVSKMINYPQTHFT